MTPVISGPFCLKYSKVHKLGVPPRVSAAMATAEAIAADQSGKEQMLPMSRKGMPRGASAASAVLWPQWSCWLLPFLWASALMARPSRSRPLTDRHFTSTILTSTTCWTRE